jgi:predicted molibdopterin-dependent oxidoreductase YjgC
MTIDGTVIEAKPEERLVDLLNRTGTKIPQVCYHPQLGPIQTCDTCMVEVNGTLVRACATMVEAGMEVSTKSGRAMAAQREAFDRILGNHMLYCTVCDNNNGNCTVHNATKLLAIKKSLSSRNLMPLIRRIRFTVMIRINAFFAAVVWRRARTFRSTRPYPSSGKTRIRVCCGTEARRLASRAASRAAIA